MFDQAWATKLALVVDMELEYSDRLTANGGPLISRQADPDATSVRVSWPSLAVYQAGKVSELVMD